MASTNMSAKPMYQKIKDDLLHQIQGKLLVPGSRIPTEAQLMQQYQVSRITVSKALNELKSEGIIERYPSKGSFVTGPSLQLPQEEAASLDRPVGSGPLIPEIACIIPSIPDLFSLSMINGVLSAINGSYICRISTSNDPQTENYLLKRCLDTNVSGIVLFPQDQPFYSNELLFMQLHKYPLVLLDRYLPRLDTNYVISDNQASGELCMRHLHDLGHQRFAFFTCSGRDTLSIDYRLKGIYSAAKDLSIPDSSIHIVDHFRFMERNRNYDDLLLHLVRGEKVTGIITSESEVCSYLYGRFAALKIDVPGSVSLLSFDCPLSAARNPGFFTYINQSEYHMGREAGLILRRQIEKHDRTVYHKVIPPILKVNHSTGRAVL